MDETVRTTASVAAVEWASGLAQEVRGRTDWVHGREGTRGTVRSGFRRACGQGRSKPGGGRGWSEAAAGGRRGRGGGTCRRRRPRGVRNRTEEAGEEAVRISKERAEGAGCKGR